MSENSLPVIAGASVDLSFGDKTYSVKPISWRMIAEFLEHIAKKRLETLPSVSDVMHGAHNPGQVAEALRTLVDLRNWAANPTNDDFIEWLTSSINNYVLVVAKCIGDSVPTDDIFNALKADIAGGGVFVSRWMEVSGIGGNPTQTP